MRASSLILAVLLTGCSSALVDLSSFTVKTWPSRPIRCWTEQTR